MPGPKSNHCETSFHTTGFPDKCPGVQSFYPVQFKQLFYTKAFFLSTRPWCHIHEQTHMNGGWKTPAKYLLIFISHRCGTVWTAHLSPGTLLCHVLFQVVLLKGSLALRTFHSREITMQLVLLNKDKRDLIPKTSANLLLAFQIRHSTGGTSNNPSFFPSKKTLIYTYAHFTNGMSMFYGQDQDFTEWPQEVSCITTVSHTPGFGFFFLFENHLITTTCSSEQNQKNTCRLEWMESVWTGMTP